MHPEIASDKPGTCPICKMTLQTKSGMGGQHGMPIPTAKDYVIFGAIIMAILVGAIGLTYALSASPSLAEGMRWFEGLFFTVFAGFKLARYHDFVDAYAGYDIIAKRWKGYALAYPFIELILAAGYLFNIWLPLVLALTIVVMAIGFIGVTTEIKKGSRIMCACLGTVIRLPLTKVTLAEDAVMGAMAVVMLILAV